MAENIDVNVNVNTKDANKAIDALNNSITGLLAVLTGREVIQFADGITSLRNKLMTLTPSIDVVNKQFNAIAGIAINARTPLEATADLFFRIARSADQLGISQKETAQITDSLAKAMSASGLSAQEAAGPLLQLGQALQSGTFQGDELRSILEGLPPVAKAIADELGEPVGALKKLGSEGQISADVFVKAMRKAKDSIDEAFARTTPTITQSIETLKSVSKVLFNEFEKNTQTGKNLGIAIKLIAAYMLDFVESVDKLITPLKILLAIGTALLSWTLVGKIFNGIKSIFGGVAATGTSASAAVSGLTKTFEIIGYRIGKFLEAGEFTRKTLDGIIKSAKYLGLDLLKLGEIILKVGGAFAAFLGLDAIFDFFKKTSDGSSDASKKLQEFDEKVKKMSEGLSDAAPTAANLVQQQQELAKALAKSRLEMEATVGGLDRQLSQTRERLSLENELFKLLNLEHKISQDDVELAKAQTDIDIERRNALAQINDQITKLNLEYNQLVRKDSQRGKEIQQQIGVLNEQVTRTKQLYDSHESGMVRLLQQQQTLKILDEDRKRTQENIVKAIELQIAQQQKLGDIAISVNDKIKEIQFAGEQQKRSPLEQKMMAIQEEARKAALEAGRAFAAMFEGTDLTAEQAQQLADGLDLIAQKYKLISDEQMKQLEYSRTWESGWKSAFNSYMDNALNASRIAGEQFGAMTRNMESAIDQFVDSGKFKFSDLAKSIIKDLIKIELKAQATAAFKAIAGTAGTFLSSIFGFANGGTPPVGKPSIVGEKGPELFVPKTSGTIVPNNQLGSMGGGGMNAPVTNNYITNNISALDAKSVAQLFAENRKTLYGTVELARKEVSYGVR